MEIKDRFLFGMVAALYIMILTGCKAGNVSDSISAKVKRTPEQIACQFISEMTRNEMLYEENDVTVLTVIVLSEEQRKQIEIDAAGFQPFTELRREAALPVQDSIDYLMDKQYYLSNIRQMQGIFRHDFKQSYECEEIEVTNDIAHIKLIENLAFVYDGEQQESFLSVCYELFLVCVNDEWLIYDVFADDGFDCEHKGKPFNAEGMLG